jgi:hypothetical protein
MNSNEPSFFHKNRGLPKPGREQNHNPFTTWDCIRALTEFHRDYGGIAEDLRDPEALGIPMGERVAELYTDLVEAQAQHRLPAMVAEFRQYIEDGGWDVEAAEWETRKLTTETEPDTVDARTAA